MFDLVTMPNSSIMNQPLRNHGNPHEMLPPTDHGAMGHGRLIDHLGVIYNTPLQKMGIISLPKSQPLPSHG